MDDIVESGCSSRPGRQDAVNEALREDTSSAQICIAAETPRRDHKLNPSVRPVADPQGIAYIGYGFVSNLLHTQGKVSCRWWSEW
jgi:hypothetical protein